MKRKKRLYVNLGRLLPLMGGRYTKVKNANWVVDRVPRRFEGMNMSWKLTNVVDRSFLRHMLFYAGENVHGIFCGKQ